VFGMGRAAEIADAAWTKGMLGYVRARRLTKRAAKAVLGDRSVDWWARR